MHKLFFDIQYDGLIPLLFRCLALIIAAALIAYLFFLVLSKILFKKKPHHKDHILRLSRLWTMVILMLAAATYFFFLIKQVGVSSIHWTQKASFLGLLPFIILYILVIATFLIDYYTYRNKIVSTKII